MKLYGPHEPETAPRLVTVLVGPGTEVQVPEHPDATRLRRQVNELARWRAACAHVAAGGAPLVR